MAWGVSGAGREADNGMGSKHCGRVLGGGSASEGLAGQP